MAKDSKQYTQGPEDYRSPQSTKFMEYTDLSWRRDSLLQSYDNRQWFYEHTNGPARKVSNMEMYGGQSNFCMHKDDE